MGADMDDGQLRSDKIRQRIKAKEKKYYLSIYASIGFMLLIGIGLFVWVYTDTKLVVESEAWEETEAEVLKTGMGLIRGKHVGPQYLPKIIYEFSYKGKKYKGQRFHVPPSLGPKEEVINLLKEYSVGTMISVYVDPKDPSKSVVFKPYMNHFFTFLLGGLSLAIIIISIFAAIKTRALEIRK